jgi:hypothetical protein
MREAPDPVHASSLTRRDRVPEMAKLILALVSKPTLNIDFLRSKFDMQICILALDGQQLLAR